MAARARKIGLDKKLQAQYWDLQKREKLHKKAHKSCDEDCEKMKGFLKEYKALDGKALARPSLKEPEPAPKAQQMAIKEATRAERQATKTAKKVDVALGKVGIKKPTASFAQFQARKRSRLLKSKAGRLVIELKRDEEKGHTYVHFIPAPTDDFPEGVGTGEASVFHTDVMLAENFDEMYPIAVSDTPVEEAAKLFVGYMQESGATPRAIEEMAMIVDVSDKEKEIAMAKGRAVAEGKKGKSVKVGDGGKSRVVQGPAKRGGGGGGGRGESAASMFRELIMAGKQTDDQIFAAVKKKWGLDDNKRGYVAWYRNDLRKKGKKPPEARE